MKGLIPWKRLAEGQVPVHRRSGTVEALQRRMNDLFEDFFEDFGEAFAPASSPLLRRGEEELTESPSFEVSETDEEFRVKAELPGMDEKDVEISIEGDELTIRGEKKEEHEEKRRDYHLSEMSYGEFYRCFRLPEGVDRDKAKAQIKKGVLTLTLPKAEQAKLPRKHIEVNAA